MWTACSSVCVCCSDSPDPAATPLPWPPSSLYVDRPLSWPHHPESPLSLRRRRRAAGQAAAARVRRPCRARKHGLCHEARRYRNVRVQRNKRKCCIINEQSTGPERSEQGIHQSTGSPGTPGPYRRRPGLCTSVPHEDGCCRSARTRLQTSSDRP